MAEEDPVTRINLDGRLDTGVTASLLSKGSKASVKPGDLLDQRFLLEHELGRGGMSVVFRARDLIKEHARDPDPFVAIKVLTGDFSEHPDAWIALQREINKAQTLAHPRIVTVHDFKVDRDLGVPFAQMEELRGESLQAFIQRHPSGVEERMQLESLIQSIAEGLEYAHKQGIVHADLKPSNVFMTQGSGVKLLDFGIARFTSGQDGDIFDANDLCALTPAYASPQIFDRQTPTTTDDVFALGIISYQLATGKHPFDALMFNGRQWVATQVVIDRLKRPATLGSAQWRAVKACFNADPALRPADGADFLSRFRRRDKSARNLAALAAGLALVAVVGWLLPRAPQPEIPEDQLPAERREALRVALDSGENALTMRDFNGALVHYAEAFDLHPYNPVAMQGLKSVVDAVVNEGAVGSDSEIERRLAQIDILLAYPALAESSRLLDYRDELSEKLATQ